MSNLNLRRKAGGYIDLQAINHALRANKRARAIMTTIVNEKPDNGRLYQMLFEVAQCLSIELESLTTMREIRQARKDDGG